MNHTIKTYSFLLLLAILATAIGIYAFAKPQKEIEASPILSYEVNPQEQNLAFYWKDKEGQNYVDFQGLSSELEKENRKLVFAMNGGMFNKDLSPQGLFIEEGIIHTKLDTARKGYGNFYLQPNGVFYLSKERKPFIKTTAEFNLNENIAYATQSGPMLLINGDMHPAFNEGSANLHIRNGVGILPNGNLLFAMSKKTINFFDFASFFKKKGCDNALYLDGFVSRTYLPSKDWKQLEGNFGVIIAEVK